MSYTKVLLSLGLIVAFSGCAQKVQMQNMVVKNTEHVFHSPEYETQIRVLPIVGERGTNSVENREFERALVASLKDANLFSKDGKYKLKADILELNAPAFGYNVTATMNVRYTLLDNENANIIFTRTIEKSYTTTMDDSYVADERVKLAKEGAAKENISAFLMSRELQIDTRVKKEAKLKTKVQAPKDESLIVTPSVPVTVESVNVNEF